MKKLDQAEKITKLLFEVGTLRKVARAHRQTLLTDDLSDNIASHSFRVTWIGMLLAKMEGVDVNKVVMMCLLHDLPESRSGDQNWVHKRYVKVYEKEIIDSQFEGDFYSDLREIAGEYRKRQSKESLVAKDADLLDQALLLTEYAHAGNREAEIWLKGNGQASLLQTKSAKKILVEIKRLDQVSGGLICGLAIGENDKVVV